MKNKDVEDIVFDALNHYLQLDHVNDKLRGSDQAVSTIGTITKEAFAAHRTKDFDEMTHKRTMSYLDKKDKEIVLHKQAISDLRGYVGYLESQIYQLEKDLGQHDEY
jgi:type 1 glutamine amidotransferase